MQPSLSPALKFSSALFQKGRCPFFLVFSPGTDRKERTFNDQAFSLARLRAPVHRLYRKFYGKRGVGIDLLQDGLSSGDQFCTWNDLIHQTDAICLLGTDRAPGQDELQRQTLSYKARKTLRSTGTRDDAQLHFRLPELGIFSSYSDGTGHCGFAAAAKSKAI